MKYWFEWIQNLFMVFWNPLLARLNIVWTTFSPCKTTWTSEHQFKTYVVESPKIKCIYWCLKLSFRNILWKQQFWNWQLFMHFYWIQYLIWLWHVECFIWLVVFVENYGPTSIGSIPIWCYDESLEVAVLLQYYCTFLSYNIRAAHAIHSKRLLSQKFKKIRSSWGTTVIVRWDDSNVNVTL